MHECFYCGDPVSEDSICEDCGEISCTDCCNEGECAEEAPV
jgi:hypothetical protein